MSKSRFERKMSELNSLDTNGLSVIAIALSVIFGIALTTS